MDQGKLPPVMLVHVGCLIEKAAAQQPHPGSAPVWGGSECQTRGQPLTGAMQTGLAEAWWLRVCDEAEDVATRVLRSRIRELGSWP